MDTYYVNDTHDTVVEAGLGGSDTVYASVNWTIQPDQWIETLKANAGSVGLTLTGNDRANTLVSGAGADTLIGLNGDDTYHVNDPGDVVVEPGREIPYSGIDTVYASASWQLPSANVIEIFKSNASSGITMTGNDFDNNYIFGGTGSDTLIGRGGSDTYHVNDSTDVVIEAVGGGSEDSVITNVDYTLGAAQEIECLFGGENAGGLILTGNEFGNTLYASQGGGDTLIGLGGDDVYRLTRPGESVIEATGGGFDKIYTAFDYTISNDQEVESIESVPAAMGPGSGITLTGNYFANTLRGHGLDTMVGRGGDDIYYATWHDIVLETAGGGNDTVLVNDEFTLGADQEVEFLMADPNYTLGVTVTGNNLNNTLIGGRYGDLLRGGLGGDDLTGAGGNDTFVFTSVAESSAAAPDEILDFQAGDKLDVHLIDADGNAANGDTAFMLDPLGDGSFGTGHIRQTIVGSTLLLSFNTDADSASEMLVLLHQSSGYPAET